jgi:hypothetical protein
VYSAPEKKKYADEHNCGANYSFAVATCHPIPPAQSPKTKASPMFKPSRIHRHVAKLRGFFVTVIFFGIDRKMTARDCKYAMRSRDFHSSQTRYFLLRAGPQPFNISEVKLARIHIHKPYGPQRD